MNTNYSRGHYSSLPTNEVDLTTIYNALEKENISHIDNIRVIQAATQEYIIHQIRQLIGTASFAEVEFQGNSTYSPAVSPVYLQIYNYGNLSWETIDSNNVAMEDEDFELTKKIPDVTNYVNSDRIMTCRVYQSAI